MSFPASLLPQTLRCVRLSYGLNSRHTLSVCLGHRRVRLVHTTASANQTAIDSDKMTGHVVDEVIKDHRNIKAVYEQYKSCIGNPADQAKWSNQYMWEVARHSVGEELVVYPALEKHVPDGKSLAEKDRTQHKQVKVNLNKLEGMSPKDPGFDQLMDNTMSVLGEHIEEEENHDLPTLRNHLTEDEGQRLGKQFERTKKFVPTRPHPHAPDRPPFETVAGLLAAPFDRLKDAFSKFPSEEEVRSVKPN